MLGKPTLQGKERVVLFAVGTDSAKREFLRSQILERVAGPGFVHLPDWLTSDQCSALVGEKRVRKVHRGRVSYSWIKKSPDQPNEALDCRIYARAALEHLGPQTIASLGALAERWKQQSEKAAERRNQPPPPVPNALPGARPLPSPNFAKRWKTW